MCFNQQLSLKTVYNLHALTRMPDVPKIPHYVHFDGKYTEIRSLNVP